MENIEDPWALEKGEIGEGQPEHRLEFKVKAHLALEGSQNIDWGWGVVKDVRERINTIPEDADVVGVWNRFSDGSLWISLQTPLSALEDRATQLYVELAQNRANATSQMLVSPHEHPKARRSGKRTTTKKVEQPVDNTFAELRSKLRGK